ncbi:MAG TPA: MucBP domain-containing protein [Candidatus Ligilactobacillus faecavium]|nr:MucBP domain-containing protein [Candidatus Ligilactobacillus faecavium]
MKSKSYIGNRYNRVKLYKKGKFWVASSITFLSLGIGAGVSTVHAANISSSSRNEEVEEVSSSSASQVSARSFSSIHMQPQSVASSVIETNASQKSSSISSSRGSQPQTDSSASSSIQSSSSVSSVSSTSKQSSVVKSSNIKQGSSSSEEGSSESSSSLRSSSSSVKISKKSEDHVSKASTESSMTKIDGPDADKALTSDLTDKENTILGPNSGIKLIQSTPVIANRKNDEEDQANDTEATLKNAVKAEDVARVRSHNSVLDVNESSYGDWTIYFVTTSGETVHTPKGYTNMYGYQVEANLETIVTTIENEGYQYIADLPITITGPYNEISAYYTLIFQPVRKQGGAVTVKYVTQSGKVLGTGTAEYTAPTGDSDSTPYIGDTYSTSAESFKGYHLVKTPANSSGLVSSKSQTVTYTYAPNVQTVTVNYIDSAEGTIVDTDNVKVAYGSSVDYNAQQFVNQNLSGYQISKSNLPANGVLSYGSSTSYNVYLTHKIDTTTQTSTYTQTIKYQYANGNQAEPTKTTTVTFTRTVKTDEVTGKQTLGQWTTSDATDLPAVVSPTIAGYTPSQISVPAVTAIPGGNDNQTVIYNPNPESMTITYYDADEGKVLSTKVLEGGYDTKPDYDYQSVIAQYEKEGYNVERSTIPSTGLVFTNSDNQSYEVDLTHTTTTLPADSPNLTETIKNTIKYIYADGSQAAQDVVQTITYTRTAIKDNVTGAVSYSNWKTSTTPAEFPAVKSPTIVGYTPSKAESSVVPVTYDSSNSTETIIYTKNGGTQTPQSDTKTTVTETVYFVDQNGNQLKTPYTATITFTRTKNSDGTYTAWQPVGGKVDFPAVDAPSISGYTPNESQVPMITNVSATTGNISKTIVYTPIQGTVVFNYYDETDGNKLVYTTTQSGDHGTTIPNDVQKYIAGFEDNGYVLDKAKSNVPSGATIEFNEGTQTFNIYFTHGTTTTTQTSTVTRTINYQYANGTQAEKPYTATITFTRSATQDNVTHQTTYSQWTTSSTDEFPAVTSPSITGYTPSVDVVPAVTDVEEGDTIAPTTVIYNPIQETVKVNYVDDTTGAVITTVTLKGNYGSTSDYSTKSAISQLESKGYVLVKDGFPSTGITFGKSASTYTVDFTEGVTDSTQTETVSQTINYVDQNGNQIADPHTATITFTRPTEKNNVTGVVTNGAWTPASSVFPQVASPVIKGYTPNAAESTAVTVDPNNPENNTQTITYTPNKETAIVQYYDETTGKVLSSVTLTGDYGTESNYNPAPTLMKYVQQGYQLVSDNLPVGGITFNYDGTTPTYKIVLKHATRTDSVSSNPDNLPTDDLQKTVSETINYVYGKDAGALAGTKAADSVTKTVTFTRTATVDQVTHQVVSYGAWTPTTGQYPAVTSPTITGYTPDQSSVAAQSNITPSSTDSTVTVTYNPNQEKFTVKFVDQTENNKVLDTVTETGAYDTKSSYSPESEIESYEKQGYLLVSNGYPTDGYTFNQDGADPTFTIVLKHNITQDTTTNNPDNVAGLSSTVNQTINYVYGSNTGKAGQTAAPTKTTSVTFTRSASYDHVTKQVTYGAWTPASSSFPAVTSPTITGYTPSAASSTAVTVAPGASNNTQTITYNANDESAKIEYIDQTDNNSIIKTDTVNGVFGQTVNYDPTDEIKALEAKGYQLVSNGVKNNQITLSNSSNQVYQIVLKHGTTTETPSSNPDNLDLTKTVSRTINYQYQNGSQAANPVTNSVTFTRTATKDNVTGNVTYTAWTSTGNAEYPAVTSPTITGYTASQTQVAASPVAATDSNSTVTVTYTPNQEKATVTFIDDTTGKTLSTQTLTGAYNTDSNYNPQATIDSYEKQGYQLVSDDYPTNGAVFGKDGVVQNYQVHLKEATETFTPSNSDGLDLKHTVTQTIHYVYSNGKQAAPDATASITFNRTATKDKVTGAITYTPWTVASSSDDFPAVKSPTITGYTPSATASTAINNVTESTPDNVQTITYTPNKETATVKYVDQTTGKTLQTITVNGVYDGTTAYDPTSVIQGYEKQGYVLVNNGVPANGITFSQDGVTPTYTVTLKHGTTTYTSTNNPAGLDLSNTVTHTVHYVYSTGGQAQPDNTQKITFTRTATKDNVTGTITYSNWGPASGTFSSVTTPTIAGYTPSATSSTAVSGVTATSANSSQTITYTPNEETATVTYVDDTTNQTIKTVTLTGAFGSTSDYSTASEISTLEKAGYQLVSNNYPNGGVKFDENGEVQHFTVHLKHTYTTEMPTNNPDGLDLSNTVTQTIKYVYNTGKQAAPTKTTSITFTRTATKDNVTGKIVGYTNWTTMGSNSFPSVVSPTITGYTPNPTATTAVDNLTGTSANNVQTVTYSPNQEKATVTFVDETTGKTLQTVTLTGAYGTTDSYNPQSVIQQYEAQGYEVSSDNYPANGVDFDEDGKVQNFTIGLTHKTTQSTQAKTVTQTINYVYSNGKQAAPTKKTSITFTRTATKDQVTGAITYTPWTSGKTSFPAVDSPAITGYTPDKKVVSAVTGVNVNTPADNVTVTYTPNQETASVQYIDDTTGQVIKTVSLSGAYNSKSDYDPDSQIQSYEKQGYKLVSNDYPANGAIFGEDGKQQVYQIHLTETTTQYTPSNNPGKLDLTDTVTHTVKYQYQDGTTAADSKTASVTFTRDATKNNVTGAITYTPWTPAISNFPQEVSPTITGYTPSVAQTTSIAVKPGDQDSTQTVVYTPNQEKITVTYIDQTTGKTLQVVTLTGAYNTKANYDPQQQIQDYENQGYQLVDNSYPQGGATFSQDGTVVNYNIYLKHKDDNNPAGLDLNHTVTETIKYVYSNGKEAAPSKTVTLTFHRDATKDDVTGKVTYGAWTPVDGTTFPAVDSPAITGYTPSQSVVNAINNVSEATPDYTSTVTYTPNQEKATVTYIDDTTGKTITVANLTGAYDTTSSYSPAATIKQLEGEGYEVVSDDYPQGGVVFNQDGKVQTFTIHLKHKTTTETATNNPDHLDLSHTITQTIKYQYADGTTASQPHTAQITYTRTATKDDVTGKVTYSDWTAASNDFPAVDSPTITGYTPNQSVVGPVQVTPTSADQTTVVTYTADQETATVTYIDDTTGKVLNKQTLTGAYGSKANYDIQSQIKNFENHGYQLVSDDYPANGEVFNNPGHVNKYVVHLKHKVTNDSTTSNPDNVADLTKTVSETITYTYTDGKTAAQSVTNKVTFTRTATKDQVTGKVTYGAWTPAGNDDFPAVDSPVITGYTPSVAQVGAVNNVAANASNIVKNVVYTPNEEKATVTFVDATTGKTISVTDLTGPYGSTSDYSPVATIKQLENQGYEVVSDNYPQGGAVFNQDGTVKNYTITLKHKVETLTPDNDPMGLTLSHKITRTIKYQFANGDQAAPSKIETITFGRTATVDEVTHQVTYSPWKVEGSDDFAPVVSPKVRDYTPNIQTVGAVDNVAEDHPNITQTVTYDLDKEKATVSYVDITTGKVLSTDDLTGDFGTASAYDPQTVIDKYESEGYQFVKSDYPANGEVFGQDGVVQHYIVQLKEKTANYTPDNNPKNLDLTKTVTRTINYVDANGKQIAPSVTQTITFTRNATVNEVTGQVTYTDWQPSGNDDYNAVDSPVVKGYTPTQKAVEAENNVSVNSTDQVVNVVYTADKPATPEHKPSEPAKKPQAPVEKPADHVQPSKKPVQTAKPAAGQSSKVETVKKAVSTKQASSANEGTVRVAEQSTTIEKQTSNNSTAQPNENKNTLPQTGEDSANHSLFGELLIALSGLLGFFGIGKRKKDKEE